MYCLRLPCREVYASIWLTVRQLPCPWLVCSVASLHRPRKLDPYDEKYMCRLVSTGKCGTAAEIQQELRDYAGIVASTDATMRALRCNGYRSVNCWGVRITWCIFHRRY